MTDYSKEQISGPAPLGPNKGTIFLQLTFRFWQSQTPHSEFARLYPPCHPEDIRLLQNAKLGRKEQNAF